MTALSSKYGSAKVLLIATAVQSFTDLRASGINIRGAFLWTIQSDSDQSFDWANNVGTDILSHP